MQTKLISLDTSTKSTGAAIYINGELSTYKCFDHSSILASEERLGKMVHSILDFLSDEMPDIVAVETASVSRNAHTQRFLTMIIGAIYGMCVQNNCFFFSFRPSEWRKLISDEKRPRKREELKKWSKDQVKTKLNIETNNDDVSDAILIGLAYINKFTEE